MKFSSAVCTSLLLIVVTTLLAGCAGVLFPDRPAKLQLQINSVADLNPDINGRSSPIVLRIYSLKSDDAFNGARFFELYENGADILGGDLLSMQELEISPSESLEVNNFKLDLDTRHVGFLAAYRDLDKAIWRDSIDTPINKKISAEVSLGRLSIAARED